MNDLDFLHGCYVRTKREYVLASGKRIKIIGKAIARTISDYHPPKITIEVLNIPGRINPMELKEEKLELITEEEFKTSQIIEA